MSNYIPQVSYRMNIWGVPSSLLLYSIKTFTLIWGFFNSRLAIAFVPSRLRDIGSPYWYLVTHRQTDLRSIPVNSALFFIWGPASIKATPIGMVSCGNSWFQCIHSIETFNENLVHVRKKKHTHTQSQDVTSDNVIPSRKTVRPGRFSDLHQKCRKS